MFITYLGLLINAILVSTPPLLLAGLGSCFSERSGVVNIGIEGMMTLGAFTGAAVAYFTGNGWLGFLCGGLAGMLLGLIHAVVCISLHADQTIAGTAINFIGPGFAVFLCKAIFENSSDSPALDTTAKLPKMFNGMFPAGSFGYNVISTYSVAYLSFLLALVCWFIFFKTRYGMRLRAAGEHPEACETLGINVTTVSQFRPSVIVGQGFIAIAAVIFGKFTPQGTFAGCLIFGLCNGIRSLISVSNSSISPNLLSMIPYLVTIATLIFFVGAGHVPAANGKIFVRSK